MHRGGPWLKLQTSLPDDPGAYVCDLLYMSWRDSRSLATAEAGIACYGELLARTPQDGVALAASAGIGSWRAEYLALPGSDPRGGDGGRHHGGDTGDGIGVGQQLCL